MDKKETEAVAGRVYDYVWQSIAGGHDPLVA